MEDGISITGVSEIHFYMSDEYVEILQKYSGPFLQERIILVGSWGCFVAFLLLLCNILEEGIKENNWYNHGPIFEFKQSVKDTAKYRQYMVYAAKTDLKTEVADS